MDAQRHFRFAPVLLAACGLVASASSAAWAGPETDFKLAVGFYNGEKYADAADHFAKFLAAARKNDPDIPTARFFRGQSLVNIEEFAKAREELQGYLRDYPKHDHVADARYNVGWCSYRLGQHEDASREFISFLNAHEKHPNAEFALVYLGDARLQLKKSADAAKAFRAAIDRYPKGTMAEDARMGLARSYELQEKFTEAADEYRAVLENPRGARRAEAQFELAGRLYDLEEYENSALQYDAFKAAFPEDARVPAAELNSGFAHFRAEDLESARSAFDDAAKTESQAGLATYWSGVCSKQLQDYDSARRSLSAAFKSDGETTLGPRILYQWADAEYLDGAYAEASKRFEQLSDTWPKDDLGDNALHEAGNAALRAGDVDRAIGLVRAFNDRYGSSGPFAAEQQILAGRIELARQKEGDLEKAVKRFENVIKSSRDEATLRHARYELARARYVQRKFAEVVKSLSPLLPAIRDEGASSPLVEAFLLQSDALLELERYADSDAAAASFLELRPQGALSARALSNRAIAQAHLGDRRQADVFLTQVALLDPESKLLLQTKYDVAEIAFEAEQFAWAAEAYQSVLKEGTDTTYEPASLAGLGWSLYRQKEFSQAADAFRSFIAKFGDDDTLGPEARYMLGKSLQDDGKPAEAAKAFTQAFDDAAPESPAPKGADATGPLRYVFLAGLQAARAYDEAGNTKAADAAYERVAKTFPEAGRMDLLLDEWALLNYDAGEFERSDELFRRIVAEHADGDRADDARFHLAESANVAGRTDEAAKAFAALVNDPKADDYVRELSQFHLLEIEVGRENWNEVVKLAAAHAKAFGDSERAPFMAFRSGEALLTLGRYAEARKALEELRAKNLSNPDVTKEEWFDRLWILIAEAALETKDYDSVRTEIEALRERSPDASFLYRGDYLLGRVNMKQGKFDLARAAFKRVTEDENGKLTETAAKSQHFIADSFHDQGDFKNAQREYFKVYVLYDYPKWQETGLLNSALCDEKLGNVDAAIKAFEIVLERFPKTESAEKARVRLAVLRKRATP